MSWHCSQALVEAFSQANVWVTGSCVRWKEIRIAERSCFGGKKTTASPSSPSGTTLTPSTGSPGMALSMSFLLDSHANRSASQETKEEPKTNETNGQLPQESLAKYDPDTSSWRTYHPLFNTWETYSPETWPASGTIKNGQLYLRDKPEPDTSENAGGWWPTPSATDSGGGVARDTEVSSTGSFSRKNKDGVRWGVPLRDAVPAHEKKCGVDRLNPDWVEWLMGWPIGWTSLDFINIDMKGWWGYCMSVEPARYWEQDPADIPVGEKYHTPRLTTKKEYRADRLKACGNGQVPQQLLLALRALAWKEQ